MYQGSRPAECTSFGHDRQRTRALRHAERNAGLYLTAEAQADGTQGAQYTAGGIAARGRQTAKPGGKRRHQATERRAQPPAFVGPRGGAADCKQNIGALPKGVVQSCGCGLPFRAGLALQQGFGADSHRANAWLTGKMPGLDA